MSPKEFNYNFLQYKESEWDIKNQIKLFLFFQSTPPIVKITCVKNEMAVGFCRIIISKRIFGENMKKDHGSRLGVVY